MKGMVPFCLSNLKRPFFKLKNALTQSDQKRKQPVDNVIDGMMHLMFGNVGTIQIVVANLIAILMTQNKELILERDEIGVLVKNALDQMHALIGQCCLSQIFELLAIDWRDEVKVE